MKCDNLVKYGMDDPTIDDDYEMYRVADVDAAIAELEEKLDIYKRGWMENDRVNAKQYAEIRHHKYKRCLAMAKWCDAKADWYYSIGEFCRDRVQFYIKWRKRWLKLAEKFKPNN